MGFRKCLPVASVKEPCSYEQTVLWLAMVTMSVLDLDAMLGYDVIFAAAAVKARHASEASQVLPRQVLVGHLPVPYSQHGPSLP